MKGQMHSKNEILNKIWQETWTCSFLHFYLHVLTYGENKLNVSSPLKSFGVTGSYRSWGNLISVTKNISNKKSWILRIISYKLICVLRKILSRLKWTQILWISLQYSLSFIIIETLSWPVELTCKFRRESPTEKGI